MFCCDVLSVCGLVFKLGLCGKQSIDGFFVGDAGKRLIHDIVKFIYQSRLYKLVKKRHLFWQCFDNMADDMLDHGFCNIHVPV